MEENISPEQAQSIKEQRKRRLQEMGLPMPIDKPAMSQVVNVKDPNMLKRIQQIKNGNLKKDFNLEVFDKGGNNAPGFQGVPEPPKNNNKKPILTEKGQPQNKIHVPLEEFTAERDPKLDQLENLFGSGSAPAQSRGNLKLQSEDGDLGRGFTQNFRNKLNERLSEKEMEAQSQHGQGYSQQLQSGMIVLNEEDLKKKIISISKQVARQVATEVIKEVLSEYAKKTTKPVIAQPKKPVVESSNNKMELLGDGRVKINGKIFRLTNDNPKP